MVAFSQMQDADGALIPLLQMARESSKKSVDTSRALVLRALSDPAVFCGFDQLKEALELDSSSATGRTLDLFSYGVYRDYQTAEAGRFLPLSDAQLAKLRQLTVSTLVQEACFQASPIIPYATLSRALDMTDQQISVLEEILMACIYSGMISGQLCQKTQSFIIPTAAASSASAVSFSSCRSRDVPQTSHVNDLLLRRLATFRSRLDSALSEMDRSRDAVRARRERYDRDDDAARKPPAVAAAGYAAAFRTRDRPATATARTSNNKRSRGGLASADVGRF